MARRRKSNVAFSLFAFQDIITSVTGIMLLITMMLALELIKRKEESPPVQTQQTTDKVEDAIASNQNEIAQLRSLLAASDEQLKYDAETLRRKLTSLKEANTVFSSQIENLEANQEETERRKNEAEEALSQTASPQQIQTMQQRVSELQQQLAELKESNRVIFNRPAGESKTPWLIEVSGQSIQVAQVGVAAPPQVFSAPAELRAWASSHGVGSTYFVMMVKPSGLNQFNIVKQDLEDLGFDIGYDLLSEDQQAIDAQTGAGVRGTSE